MSTMKDYIEALKNGKGFDWICEHGHKLNKYELIDIIKELDYSIYDHAIYDCTLGSKDIYRAAAKELTEQYICDEEE